MVTESQQFDPERHIAPYGRCDWISDQRGYIVWRRGTGDNVELLHLRAYEAKRGIQLLRDMLACLREHPPYCTVFGFTRTANDHAIKFYRRMGFGTSLVQGVYRDGEAVVFSAEYERLWERHFGT